MLGGGVWLFACGLVGSAVLIAADPVENREVLIYADGDRVRGKLVERSDGVLIFQSEKFGLLRVPVSEATVEKGDRSAVVKAPGSAAAAKPALAAAEKAGEDGAKPENGEKEPTGGWAQFSPYALTQAVREFFGPWHGRIAFSTEIANDVTDRTNTTAEVRLKRKWSNDELEGIARYDFAQSAEVTTKDVARLSGSWRRDFPRKFFGVYRPTLEWNWASNRRGSERVGLEGAKAARGRVGEFLRRMGHGAAKRPDFRDLSVGVCRSGVELALAHPADRAWGVVSAV